MQREINKLLKRVKVEELNGNHKECIELYHIVGGSYSDIGSYDEAIHYHEKALGFCKKLGDPLKTAIAWRYIGEARAALGQFFPAIEDTKKYLELAQKSHNKVEIQRAWTTLGRVYLMRAQEMKESGSFVDERTRNVAQEAEKRFQKALFLADSVRDDVESKEFAQMKSGLLMNIGLVKDICGQHRESVSKINEAIQLCKGSKLKEDLHRCLLTLTGIYRQANDIKMAVKTSEEALLTAKQIGKKLLICESLIEIGFVKICQLDFKAAKNAFATAYKEKSPNEDDHARAIKLTKLAHLIMDTKKKYIPEKIPKETELELCDRLGDLFVAISNYKLAIEFYKKALDAAKICSKPKSELARIYYSIAETCADDGQFLEAVRFYVKELTCRNGNNEEQCQTLIKIAHMHEYLNIDCEATSKAYEQALKKAGKHPKLAYTVLKDYILFLERKSVSNARFGELQDMKQKLESHTEVVQEKEAEDEEEAGASLEDEISDVDDIITDNEDNDEVLMVRRRKSRGCKKTNEVGETPLHRACIEGDLKRVKYLIGQGHEVNSRDNAGWTPLHEACNHGHGEIVEYLIEHGANVNSRALKGMSPLHDAASNGHFGIMRCLIQNRANAISLTDSGETVLGCLRDYKMRNYSEMSNEARSEYKRIEAELLNIMDKYGFNLMDVNMKNLGNKHAAVASSSSALQEPSEVEPVPRKNDNSVSLDRKLLPNSVRDYKDVIGSLKRKRLNEDPQQGKTNKANLPATYETDSNTSEQTKTWLIDDVSREHRLIKRRSNFRDLVDLAEDEEESDEAGEEVIDRRMSAGPCSADAGARRSVFSGSSRNAGRHNGAPRTSHTKKTIVLESDDEEFEVEEFGSRLEDQVQQSPMGERRQSSSESPSNFLNQEIFSPTASPAPMRIEPPSPSGFNPLSNHSFSSNAQFSAAKSPSIFNEPLSISVDGREMLIPIKDENSSIRWLKEQIVQRYSALTDVRPKISLAPASNPDCILYDDDFCRDVIRNSVIVIIDSWQLDTIDGSYVKQCHRLKIEPLDFIRMELKQIGLRGNKLDLSYMQIPKSHARPIALALARRDFTWADLTGSASFFEKCDDATAMLDAIGSWRKLQHLSLKCVGFQRRQLESICKSRADKLPELRSLDLSFNSLVYKCKNEFRAHIEKLLEVCPNLKSLDLRGNHLQFVRSLVHESCRARAGCSTDEPAAQNEAELNLAEMLDLRAPGEGGEGLKILGSEQNEFTVHSV